MQSKTFSNPDEAVEFISKIQQNNIAIGRYNHDGTISINWVPKLMYVAQDGKEYPEEIWVTSKGELVNVQDLSPEHARNVVRMFIRQNREYLNSIYGDYDSTEIAEEEPDEEQESFSTMEGAPTLDSILDDSPPPAGTLLN